MPPEERGTLSVRLRTHVVLRHYCDWLSVERQTYSYQTEEEDDLFFNLIADLAMRFNYVEEFTLFFY